MVIKCYRPETLECFDVITKCESIVWQKRFFGVGSFELHCTSNNLKKYDIIKHGKNDGIVMRIVEQLSSATIYGYDLKGFVQFRAIAGKVTQSGITETIIKAAALSMLTAGDRKIKNLVIAADQGRGEGTIWSCENENFAESLEKICAREHIGYDINFDEQSYIFDIVTPRHMERDIIFARNFKNIDDIEYDIDALDSKNTALVLGEAGNIVSHGTAKGIYRREGIAESADKVTDFLAENQERESLRGTANGKLKYRLAWQLGDFVSVRFKDLSTVKQITEVQEVFERDGYKALPIFGEQKQNPIKKLLKSGG